MPGSRCKCPASARPAQTAVHGQHLQWQNDSNFIIHTLAEKNDNVHIIDWENTAPSHPEWFYDDGIHLNADGQVAYADLLFRSISNY